MTCLKQGIKTVQLTSVMRTFPDASKFDTRRRVQSSFTLVPSQLFSMQLGGFKLPLLFSMSFGELPPTGRAMFIHNRTSQETRTSAAKFYLFILYIYCILNVYS